MPVLARSQPGEAFEQASERGGILISDRPTDLLDRLAAGLQPSLGELDPDPLDVGNRRLPRRALKPSGQGPGAEPGAVGHPFDRVGGLGVLGDEAFGP